MVSVLVSVRFSSGCEQMQVDAETRYRNSYGINALRFVASWCRAVRSIHKGFEGREGHRTKFASRLILQGCLEMKKPAREHRCQQKPITGDGSGPSGICLVLRIDPRQRSLRRILRPLPSGFVRLPSSRSCMCGTNRCN